MLWIAKGLGWLLLPPGIFVLSIAASLALLAAGWRRTAAALLAATACGLYLLSIAPV
ncbi:MAG: YdcF family protein, partial [SAR324 cluster bacterium]|nr:YdcF family protein [SAR324 cluster bacterium]